jgi:hypothetical protein
MYNYEKELFKELISKFYQRHKIYFNSDLKSFSYFVSSLLNLNCYVVEPFIEFFFRSNSSSLNYAGTQLRLSNITDYLAEKNPKHQGFQNSIQYSPMVNIKFKEDFEKYFQNYMIKRYGIEDYAKQKLPMEITIDKKNQQIISPFSQNLKQSISIFLLDKCLYYQDNSTLLNNISNHIKFSKFKNLLIEEEEFYRNINRYDTIFESKIKKIVDTLN